MPHFEPIHVLEPDRSNGSMVCTKINRTRQFAHIGPSGMALYTWQNGQWFDQGFQPIPQDQVPEQYRAAIAENPIVVSTGGPEIVWTCEFCHESMNQSQSEAHLIAHIRGTFATVGTSQPTPQPPPPAIEAAPRERQRDGQRTGTVPSAH